MKWKNTQFFSICCQKEHDGENALIQKVFPLTGFPCKLVLKFMSKDFHHVGGSLGNAYLSRILLPFQTFYDAFNYDERSPPGFYLSVPILKHPQILEQSFYIIAFHVVGISIDNPHHDFQEFMCLPFFFFTYKWWSSYYANFFHIWYLYELMSWVESYVTVTDDWW